MIIFIQNYSNTSSIKENTGVLLFHPQKMEQLIFLVLIYCQLNSSITKSFLPMKWQSMVEIVVVSRKTDLSFRYCFLQSIFDHASIKSKTAGKRRHIVNNRKWTSKHGTFHFQVRSVYQAKFNFFTDNSTIKLITTMLNYLKGSKSKKDPLEMFPTLQYVTFVVRTNKYVLLIIPLKDSFQQQRKLKF